MSATRRHRLQRQRHLLAGLLVGACLPLVAWAIDIAFRGAGWSLASLGLIHATNPLHWLVDLAPAGCVGLGLLMDRKQAQLEHQAAHDALTGLANRAVFRDRLADALRRATSNGRPPAVLVVDIDDFTAVNDGLGHAAGDALLVMAAQRLRDCVGSGNSLARLGGDKFAILAEDAAAGRALAERALDALRLPFTLAGREVFVPASVGIAAPASVDAVSAEELLRDADAATDQAKALGGGRAEVFQPGLHASALERLGLVSDLRRALERHELEVHYQPIIDLASGRIKGVEALVRWRHPQRGLLSPLVFIPLAEETGLIGQLGLWVLRQACQAVRGWQQAQPAGEEPLNLSVNLSARQLQDPALPRVVADVLAETDFDPSTLTLEITEGLLVKESETVLERLRALKALGVTLALDDFGTGYSWLSYLKRFPIDVLKIDKSFVDQVTQEPEASALVRTILSLSDTLRLRTVAEGIEQPEQAAYLRSLGCGGGQGYYFARPLTAADLEALLGTRSATQALGAA